MAILDNDFERVNQADVSLWPAAIRYGVIGGVVMVIYSLVGILTGFTNISNGAITMMLVSLLSFGLLLGIIIFAIKMHRDKDMGGYISIGRAFFVGLIVSVITMFINSLFTYLYIEFINPAYVDEMITGYEELLVGMSLPAEMMDQLLEDTRGQFELQSMFTTGLLTFAAVGAVFSIICSAIMKKELPAA